jgi:hypothetical protein
MFDDISPMIAEARAAAQHLRQAADDAANAHTVRAYGAGADGDNLIRDAEKDAVADFAEKTVAILERLNAHRRVGF